MLFHHFPNSESTRHSCRGRSQYSSHVCQDRSFTSFELSFTKVGSPADTHQDSAIFFVTICIKGQHGLPRWYHSLRDRLWPWHPCPRPRIRIRTVRPQHRTTIRSLSSIPPSTSRSANAPWSGSSSPSFCEPITLSPHPLSVDALPSRSSSHTLRPNHPLRGPPSSFVLPSSNMSTSLVESSKRGSEAERATG